MTSVKNMTIDVFDYSIFDDNVLKYIAFKNSMTNSFDNISNVRCKIYGEHTVGLYFDILITLNWKKSSECLFNIDEYDTYKAKFRKLKIEKLIKRKK